MFFEFLAATAKLVAGTGLLGTVAVAIPVVVVSYIAVNAVWNHFHDDTSEVSREHPPSYEEVSWNEPTCTHQDISSNQFSNFHQPATWSEPWFPYQDVCWNGPTSIPQAVFQSELSNSHQPVPHSQSESSCSGERVCPYYGRRNCPGPVYIPSQMKIPPKLPSVRKTKQYRYNSKTEKFTFSNDSSSTDEVRVIANYVAGNVPRGQDKLKELFEA